MSFSVFDMTLLWAKDHYEVKAESETTSTNDFAKAEGFTKKPVLYLTDFQTSGRGRGKNTWSAEKKGAHLLCSLSVPLNKPPQYLTAPLMGLAIYKSLKQTWPTDVFHIKAPNDIYKDSKKIAGLLVEVISQGDQHQLILGLGLNVFETPEGPFEADQLADKMDKNTWLGFLDKLNHEVLKAMRNIFYTELNPQDQYDLTMALKGLYKPEDDFQEVSAKGDLVFKSKTVSWAEL